MQTDVGYVPVAWVVRYAAAKPWVKGIEKNKAGEFVVDGNIYVDMFEHIYIDREGLGELERRGRPSDERAAPASDRLRRDRGRSRTGSAAARSGCARSASGRPGAPARRCRGPAA